MKLTFEIEFGKFEGFVYRDRKPANTLVKGMGINDSPFIIEPAGSIRHPAYKTWKSMLTRCYSNKCKEKHPTYIDVGCCTEWLTFTTFAKWFKDNYKEGYNLDKDILVDGNKIYGPNTCIFVPQYINLFLILSGATRGELPIGVTLYKGGFISRIGNGKSQKYLGFFTSKEEAHRAWQKSKLEQAIAFNFPPLQRIIDQLKFEVDNNIETIKL